MPVTIVCSTTPFSVHRTAQWQVLRSLLVTMWDPVSAAQTPLPPYWTARLACSTILSTQTHLHQIFAPDLPLSCKVWIFSLLSCCLSQIFCVAYSSACNATANVVLAPNQIALQLPETWDGPFVAVLPFGGALFVVIVGGMIGMSALYIFANLL